LRSESEDSAAGARGHVGRLAQAPPLLRVAFGVGSRAGLAGAGHARVLGDGNACQLWGIDRERMREL
jgi:hypothetical protein